jgi:hypothetical protein
MSKQLVNFITCDCDQNTWRIGHEANNNEQNYELKRYLWRTCMLYPEGTYHNASLIPKTKEIHLCTRMTSDAYH